MSDREAFCPRCGVARARGEAQPSSVPCPGCRTVLNAVTVGGVAMLECPGCDGIWLEAAAFEQICTSGESRAAVLHRRAAASPVAPERRVRYRPCVRCGRMMNRVNFARLSGTILDVCRGHGTFLDRGELHAIATFIHEGGLGRMRERELADARDEQRRLAAGEERATRARTSREGAPGGWDSTSLSEIMKAILGD